MPSKSPYTAPEKAASPLPPQELEKKRDYWNRMTWISLAAFPILSGACVLLTYPVMSILDGKHAIPPDRMPVLILALAFRGLVVFTSLGFVVFSVLRYRVYRKELLVLAK